MPENCKDCLYIKTLESVTSKLQEVTERHERDISELKTQSELNSLKLINFKEALDKIDKGVDAINRKLEAIDKKPNEFWGKIAAAVVGSVVTFAIIEAIKAMGGK